MGQLCQLIGEALALPFNRSNLHLDILSSVGNRRSLCILQTRETLRRSYTVNQSKFYFLQPLIVIIQLLANQHSNFNENVR